MYSFIPIAIALPINIGSAIAIGINDEKSWKIEKISGFWIFWWMFESKKWNVKFCLILGYIVLVWEQKIAYVSKNKDQIYLLRILV